MTKKSDKTEPSPQLQELERKVDALMSTEKLPEAAQPAETPEQKSDLKVVSDYAGSPQTAPELSPKLRKTVKTAKTPAPKATAKTTAVPPAPAETEPADETPSPPETKSEAEQPESEPETPAPSPEVSDKSIIDDAETDKAVADIVVREGDMQLAVDDAITRRKASAVEEPRSTISSYWTFLFFIIIVGTAAVLYLWFR